MKQLVTKSPAIFSEVNFVMTNLQLITRQIIIDSRAGKITS